MGIYYYLTSWMVSEKEEEEARRMRNALEVAKKAKVCFL